MLFYFSIGENYLRKIFHLWVSKMIENLDYFKKYERYEDEPKRKSVPFVVLFATVFTEGSLDPFVRSRLRICTF